MAGIMEDVTCGKQHQHIDLVILTAVVVGYAAALRGRGWPWTSP
ncbi:hypothetical protein SANTM175S_03967 [Streptomyces antimycoticus]